MNKFKFEDIKLNMQEEFSVKITEKMQEEFKMITGDINPIHSDDDFSKEKGFDKKIVYGMLTASFFSTLVGVYLPGENSLFQECKDLRFHSPVYIGDELTVNGKVVEIEDRFKRIGIKATIKNQDGTKVCSAKLYVGVI